MLQFTLKNDCYSFLHVKNVKQEKFIYMCDVHEMLRPYNDIQNRNSRFLCKFEVIQLSQK